jgi:ribose/xylose/arabinose/galactoside ABC-type transport system permease subunit
VAVLACLGEHRHNLTNNRGISMKKSTSSSFFDIFQKPAVGPLLSLLIACIFFATQSPRFLTGGNFSLIVQQVSVVGALAIGQTLVILTGGIDLSNGVVMAFGGVLMASLAMEHGVDPFLSVILGIAVCVVFGLLNGLLVTYVRIPPFISHWAPIILRLLSRISMPPPPLIICREC